MRRFHVGDQVRIVGLPGSEWHDRRGRIVEIFEHGPYEETEISQECAVDLGGSRRWFMAKHLVQTVSIRLIRFFRTEVLDRWPLEPNDVGSLNGDREELVGLLCDRLSFAMRCAEAEVDDFYAAFDDRVAGAIEPSPPKDVPPDKPTHALQAKLAN